ncbi:TPA: hypothetical protein QDZ34_001239 [Stenotrophomonas maltophilia]|nr:hypothetical protein [Stenotrophomonas maltophilia]HDS1025420.1 hypothetical protein [Stenotrophomonas maltophilia]HDS1028157.1 hypothetical protein [Stenotrophomonas maltophilia]HDS1029670.1 hypothetical protein [Stenotrophomonas maltophilia]HDS1033908.1 hypothetical protein [Stenotrophomonas maltophilia]
MLVHHRLRGSAVFSALSTNLGNRRSGHVLHLWRGDTQAIRLVRCLFIGVALGGRQGFDATLMSTGYGHLYLLNGADQRVGSVQFVADVALSQRIVDPAVMQPFAIGLPLIGAPVGGQYAIGVIAGPYDLLWNLSVPRPALCDIRLLVLFGECGRTPSGVVSHGDFGLVIKMGRFAGIGHLHRGALDAVLENLMDNFTPPLAVFGIPLPGPWKEARCVGGVTCNAEGIDWAIRL